MPIKVDGTNNKLIFYAGGPNATSLAGAAGAVAWTMTLPVGPGTAGQVLSTDGAGNLSWVTGGGAASIPVTNDTTTAANQFPLFSSVSTGTLSAVSTASPDYTYNPASGQLSASYTASSGGMDLNPNTIPTSYTLPSNYNSVSGGPVLTPAGVVVTVNAGSRWTVV